MEPLFRLTLLRPPVQQDPAHPSIRLAQDSPYQVELAAALDGDDERRDRAVALSRQLIESDVFVADVHQLDVGHHLTSLSARLDELEATADASPGTLSQAIEASFDATAGDIVAGEPYQSAVSRLRDSIVAVKFVQAEHGRPVHLLTARLRDLEVIARAADDE